MCHLLSFLLANTSSVVHLLSRDPAIGFISAVPQPARVNEEGME